MAASRHQPLPTEQQCYALTDNHCRSILDYRDPNGLRINPDWEPGYQPELVRHYMRMLSFKQIEDIMRPRLAWTYKTYQNRFKDWQFPLDRFEREQVVREIFGWISGRPDYIWSATPAFHDSLQLRPGPVPILPNPPPTGPLKISPDFFQSVTVKTEMAPSQPDTPMSGISVSATNTPPNFFQPGPVKAELLQTQPQPDTPMSGTSVSPEAFQSGAVKVELLPPRPDTRMSRISVSTTNTYASSTHSFSPWDETFSSRASIATTNSSVSSGSHYGVQYHQPPPPPPPQPVQIRQPRQPRHDPVAGLWNNVLRVIPCNTNHSQWAWDTPFNRCAICGFSQWHSLMVHAQSIGKDNLRAAMTTLRLVPMADFAGNFPIHYLMSAGVGLELLLTSTTWTESCPRNVFDQNPLHVLQPLGLGDHLVSFWEWLNKNTPMLLLQRDTKCRTPLQTLLLWPLERHLYSKILNMSPFAEQQLRALDNTGRNIVMRMNDSSMHVKARSPSTYAKLQAGITEIKLYQNTDGRTENRNQQYGFHNIARGGRGRTYYLGHFECYICNQVNTHTNSFLNQMFCAVDHGRDRYEPDDTGMTPAQALITHSRVNMDEERTPETPNQTYQLFRFLVPNDDPKLDEALHALDPEGHSLIYNIATRGLDEILDYVIKLEHPSRRRAVVNFCTRGGRGESVLEAVQRKYNETTMDRDSTSKKDLAQRELLREQGVRLINCRSLLRAAGAVNRPDATTRLRINFD